MTAIPHPLNTATQTEPAHATHEHVHAEHHDLGFFKRYIFSTDHKIIGIEFLFVGMAFFVLGGLLALLVRWQLGFPGQAVPLLGKFMISRGWTGGAMPPDFYTVAFSMHATFMIFFVVIPLLVGTFGNYLIPLKIGAPDMAFPFLNGFAFWLAVPSGALMLSSLFLQGGASQAGWTAYPPLSAIQQNNKGHIEYEKPDGPFTAIIQKLRIHDLGGLLTGAIEVEGTTASQTYAGHGSHIKEGMQNAASSLEAEGWSIVSNSAGGMTLKSKSGSQVIASLTSADGEGTLTVKATDEAGVAPARQFLARASTKLKDVALVGPDAGKAWQSSWNAFGLITNYLAWFCAFLFIAAYQIRLGSRWVNIPLAIVICGVLAYFVMQGVQAAAFDGQSAWFLSIIILGFSSILGAVNYLTTIVKFAAPA